MKSDEERPTERMAQSPAEPEPGDWDNLSSEEEEDMGFLDHLEELRWVLFKSLIAFVLGMTLVFSFLGFFTEIVNAPLYRIVGTENLPNGQLVTTSPMGILSLLLQIGFLGGLGLAMPFILYFVASFIAPALTERERKLLLPACLGAGLLFLGGVLLGYFVILPGFLTMANFLHQQIDIAMFWAADRYYSLVVWLLIGLGFAFQFPLVLLALIQLDIVQTKTLVLYRRHMIVVFFIVGMMISPTWDPFTQTAIAMPMWLLYEGTIRLGRRLEKRRAEMEKEVFKDVLD
ncbi:MAG: twin-arginine translocase subunit TatC [Opitutales bacterium]|nr:twin-arginine translocase subunit TatC [Opitutales bacterium]MCH8540043.1 twin-arginine translocase subunit TatC [Opitutales bacterium]